MITFEGNHPEFSSKLNEFLSSRASEGGLPKDILMLAYKGYKQDIVPWQFVIDRAQDVRAELKSRMPEAIFDLSIHECDEIGKAAIALSVHHISAAKMDVGEEAFFNGSTNTFLFWRWGVWLLQTNDVVGSMGHLHRRVMTRDNSTQFSFTGLHDAVSSLWLALIEVAQKRREAGELAALNYFTIPYSIGLIYAEFQKLKESHKFRPVLRVLDKEIVTDIRLATPFSMGDDHLLVMPKTFITRFNTNQKKLHSILIAYINKHSEALKFFRRSGRYLYDSPQVGKYMRRTFNDEPPPQSSIRSAVDELDALTRSPEWMKESERSRRSAERSKASATVI